MKRVFWASFAVLFLVVAARRVDIVDAHLLSEPDAVERHFETAMSQMDSGMRSPQYRESIAFLRDHADGALERLTPVLLDESGSVRKWQVTYLIGEFGNEPAIALLRDFLEAPLPVLPDPARDLHPIDIQYTEEIASRFQAVSSTARIASHRPHLRPDVVSSIVDIGRNVPLATSAAIFELRKLLGPEAEAFRHHFGPEHTRDFDRYLPSPKWQGLLGERMQRRAHDERLAQESGLPLCLD